MCVGGPRLVTRAAGPALWIGLRVGRHAQGDLTEWIPVAVWIAWRITTVVLQGPLQDTLLAEIGVLEMADPAEEVAVAFEDGAEPFVGIGPIARNARIKLGDQP